MDDTRDRAPADLSSLVEPGLRTVDGVVARIEREGGAERLRVRDPQGRLVFEYAHGRMVLSAPEGDLELRAPQGQVKIDGARGVSLASDGAESLRVSRDAVKLDTDRVEMNARRVDATVQEATLRGRVLRTLAERTLTEVERVEVRAGRVIERAKEVYREVEGLSQTRAGRLKLIAEKALQMLADDVTVKARRDAKIKGEKIYLA